MILGVEDGNGAGTWVAYTAIVAFLFFLMVVIARSLLMYVVLLILPIGRVLRVVPGLGGLIDRLEKKIAAGQVPKCS